MGPRRARELVADLPGVRIGNAVAVERAALLGKLAAIRDSDSCAREAGRRTRVAEHLAGLRKDLAARRIRLPAAADVRSRQMAGLPAAIELRPGELRIRFFGAEDLAAQLFELSQAMANDWERFRNTVEGDGPGEPG